MTMSDWQKVTLIGLCLASLTALAILRLLPGEAVSAVIGAVIGNLAPGLLGKKSAPEG